MAEASHKPEPLRLELLPLGKTLTVQRGASLRDILFDHGVEFPCGGQGRCKGCRIKVLSGSLPITEPDQRKLTEAELEDGWRLGCGGIVEGDLKLELAQWETTILSDESVFPFTPREGLGVAIDLGTTTVVAQLLDLQTGRVLAVRTGLNSQAQHGADIMSRVEFATAGQGQKTLERLIRGQLGGLVEELCRSRADTGPQLERVVLVGNTVMHHLFSGISVEPLAHFPFEPATLEARSFRAHELGWQLPGNPPVEFLPCLGGFVGSDILAGILATKLHESEHALGLIDLGTNGEIVVGNRQRMLCASTAAGPAFEGARISMGMRAATGAISEVSLHDGQLRCHVLGNVPARGICGSGLVDAAAMALDLNWIEPSGRLARTEALPLVAPVQVTQRDIRELQLAKGAIAAGLKLLLAQWGTSAHQIRRVFLAGAFGNYINQASARRIGLLDFPAAVVQPVGNTALLGAKLALFGLNGQTLNYDNILERVEHVSLSADPLFQDVFAQEMGFPARPN